MEFLDRVDRGLEREGTLLKEAKRPPAAVAGPGGEPLPRSPQEAQRLIEQVKEVTALTTNLPRAMAAAGGAIMLFEEDLRGGEYAAASRRGGNRVTPFRPAGRTFFAQLDPPPRVGVVPDLDERRGGRPHLHVRGWRRC